MDGTPMPGGWMLSMAWQRMCQQSWTDAAASFLAMWVVMMVAMMLPSLVPGLARCHEAMVARGERHPSWQVASTAAAYFAVWTAIGAAIYPLGAGFAAVVVELPALARAVPVLGAGVVLAAGAFQFSAWKARHLADCRGEHAAHFGSGGGGGAWSQGLRLGMHCSASCAGCVAALLVLGVMDPLVMALVTTAITFERLAADGVRAARVVGAFGLAAGLVQLGQAAV